MSMTGKPLAIEGFREAVAMDVAIWAKQHGVPARLYFVLRHLVLCPGFHFVFWHRVVRLLRRIPLAGGILSRIMLFWLEIGFSSQISLSARIGGGLYTPHPFGIVIGMGSKIGKNVTIHQHVTLGSRSAQKREQPSIEDDAYVGAGAVLLGPITIGQAAKIGANAVVLNDVPAGCVAVGNPAKVTVPSQ